MKTKVEDIFSRNEKKKVLNFLSSVALKTDCYTTIRIADDYIELHMVFGDIFDRITIAEEFYFDEYSKWINSYKENIKNQVKECTEKYNSINKDIREFIQENDLSKITNYGKVYVTDFKDWTMLQSFLELYNLNYDNSAVSIVRHKLRGYSKVDEVKEYFKKYSTLEYTTDEEFDWYLGIEITNL